MGDNIRITSEPSQYNDQVTVLRIEGVVDATTESKLKEAITQNMVKGKNYILIDMAHVDYISSAGIGSIISMLKKIRNYNDGDIKLCNSNNKITRVLESVGMHLIMEIFETEQEAETWVSHRTDLPMDHFDLEMLTLPLCGKEFKVRVTARNRDKSIAEAYYGAPVLSLNKGIIVPHELHDFENGEWTGNLTITDSGPLTLTISEGKIQNRFDLIVGEEKRKVVFPLAVRCSDCGRKATVPSTNIYQCKQCQGIFYVDVWGNVVVLKKGNPIHMRKFEFKGFEIKINSNINYLHAIRKFIVLLCESENIDELIINDIVLATEEVLLNIIEHSYDFDAKQIIFFRIQFKPGKVVVMIYDYGAPFDITRKQGSVKSCLMKGRQGGVGGIIINKLMDQVEYQSTKKINRLVMIKAHGPDDDVTK